MVENQYYANLHLGVVAKWTSKWTNVRLFPCHPRFYAFGGLVAEYPADAFHGRVVLLAICNWLIINYIQRF